MFLGTHFEMLGKRDEDGLPLPSAQDPDGVGPHLEDMEILLHRTQCRLDDQRIGHRTTIMENIGLVAELVELRGEFHITSEQSGALARQLFDLRKEHDVTTARNLALAGQLRTTRLGRSRLTKKVEALQEANAILRGLLKTAREELATRDSTIEELEEENTELHEGNEDLLIDRKSVV